MQQRLFAIYFPLLLLLSFSSSVSSSASKENKTTHSLVKRTSETFELGKTIMTIIKNFRTVIFLRLLGINTVIVAFNTIGLLLITLLYELINAGSTNRISALEKIFGFQAIVGLITRVILFYVWALVGLSFFIMVKGFDEPEFENVTPIDFIINDMFGFALSFVGIHPNVGRLMVIAVIQFIGWSFLAQIGLLRLGAGSNTGRRKRRAVVSQSEDPLLNLFSSVNPYFILDSLSKFD